MQISDQSCEENNIINNRIKKTLNKGIDKKNVKSYLIICFLIIISFASNFYLLKNIKKNQEKINQQYAKLIINNKVNLPRKKESFIQIEKNKHYFLKKLIKKSFKLKNLNLLNIIIFILKKCQEKQEY